MSVVWKSCSDSLHLLLLQIVDYVFGTNLFAPTLIQRHAKAHHVRLPTGFLEGFDALPSVVMNEIFINVAGDEIPNLRLVSKRWMGLISARRSRYARNSISDLTISFNNGIRYITQPTRRNSIEVTSCSRRWCSHDLASAVPHISIDCLELRIHNINEQFDDLQLSTIDTRTIDIKLCRPIGSASAEYIVGLLTGLSQNRSIEVVRVSSEVVQPSTVSVNYITELFSLNKIQLSLEL
ncbi:hypothetical protein Q1695_006036 [Nippostrongylus brasiliensis]|nr:hypothetical protein Q1695_006036 [Nippostrongylus brasiliensis]